MNIVDAIKSGKLHKRKINREWCHAPSVTNQFSLTYSIDDILADDWEIEEVRVTINASDLKMAWIKACENIKRYDDTTPSHWLCVELKKELGL